MTLKIALKTYASIQFATLSDQKAAMSIFEPATTLLKNTGCTQQLNGYAPDEKTTAQTVFKNR